MTESPPFLLGQNLELNLDTTLNSGQAFRWQQDSQRRWVGVIQKQVVRLWQEGNDFFSQTYPRTNDIGLLRHYLQLDVSLSKVVQTFPDDPHLRTAVRKYFGLRLLRQDPWECLASFILSSTKRITHIRQIVAAMCRELGEKIQFDGQTFFTFPCPTSVAASSPKVLRQCKAGFRAEYLWETANEIASGRFNLNELHTLSYRDAHNTLTQLPGVGNKIADCVLLFAFGKQEAFPMDVWIERALRRLYFAGKRRVTKRRLDKFRASYFGPFAGYAQQYLFHYVRMNPDVIRIKKASQRQRAKKVN